MPAEVHFLSVEPPQPRFTPRIETVVTGVIERTLFTTLAIPLIRAGDAVTILGAICAVYIGLKAIKRVQITDKITIASLHSIWGSGVSLGFAVFAGWLFNQVYPPAIKACADRVVGVAC